MSILDIDIRGGSASQKKRVDSFVRFCVQKLVPRISYLDIQVNLCAIKSGDLGYCNVLRSKGERCDRPRSFMLEIHKHQPLRKMLETIAHEMVHIKQFASSQLYLSANGRSRWNMKWINVKKIEYWDLPWEIDAHGRETGLFVRWAEKEKLAGRAWTQVT